MVIARAAHGAAFPRWQALAVLVARCGTSLVLAGSLSQALAFLLLPYPSACVFLCRASHCCSGFICALFLGLSLHALVLVHPLHPSPRSFGGAPNRPPPNPFLPLLQSCACSSHFIMKYHFYFKAQPKGAVM